MQQYFEKTASWATRTIPARILLLALLFIAAEGAFAEISTEIIDKVKARFFDIYYRSEAVSIAEKLGHRGLAASTQVGITTDITGSIASCIVDGLNEGGSQVAYTYLVLIADESVDEDISGRLRDAYPSADMDEFNNLTAQLMRDCREAAYAKHHLSSD